MQMETKKPVYRDDFGNEADPVEFVGSLWMNNTLPSIAMDAIAQFILVNALVHFEDLAAHPRVEWPVAMTLVPDGEPVGRMLFVDSLVGHGVLARIVRAHSALACTT